MKDLEKKGDTALASFPLLGCNTGNQELQIEKTNSCFHRDNIWSYMQDLRPEFLIRLFYNH